MLAKMLVILVIMTNYAELKYIQGNCTFQYRHFDMLN